MSSGILGDFQETSVTSYKMVIRWAYQHPLLAGEVKNSAKVKLLSFNRIDVFSI